MKPQVILRHCAAYDAEAIRAIVRDGLHQLGLKPSGRTLVKPNLVAAGHLFPYAYTRPEFGEGVLRALKDVGGDAITELALGERSGITMPTRFVFKESGFDAMLDRLPDIKRYYMEEEEQVEIPLRHEGRLRDYVFTPAPFARTDFFVNMPKFKSHPWTTVTFGCKNYIGLQDDRHRLIDHDNRLEEKVADLQYIIQPQFLAIDAITANQGMFTPRPFELKLVIMGNNQVAFDAVCCAIIGVDPRTIDHIRLSSERGFGPINLSEIEISGDVTLAEAQKRGKGFMVGRIRADTYFEGSKISAYVGPPPEAEHSPYCWGGCPTATVEAVDLLRTFDRNCDARMKRMHVVFGAYRGAIDAKPGEKVIFFGDCANWEGRLGDQLVQIRSTYQDRSTKDPHHATHSGIYAKMASVSRVLRKTKKQPYVRFEGCPVTMAEQVLALVKLGGTKNPYFVPADVIGFNRAYLTWRIVMFFKRLFGKKYQRPGPCLRGQAMPLLAAAADPPPLPPP